MKIHIIGCSGSGKTYLANAFSQKYGIPHLDLDDIFWDNREGAYGSKYPPEIRDQKLSEVLQSPGWVTEGVYYSWNRQCFADADVIYLLDIPKRIYLFRVVKRFLRRKIGLEPGKSGNIRSLMSLIRWTEKFQKQNMKEIRKILDTYENKVEYITTTKEINALIHKHFNA